MLKRYEQLLIRLQLLMRTCSLRWLPIVVRMETGTKIEILSLAGSHACCGTIFRAAGRFREFRACGSFKSQTKNKMSLRFHNRASSGKFAKISARNLSNTAKLHEDCTLGIEREKLKLKRRKQISRRNSRNISQERHRYVREVCEN